MKIKLYHIDSFTDSIFKGNPAVVCPLDRWLTNDQMQKIANENCVSETAFFVKNGQEFDLRWFTPEKEIDLCGHATLAAAYVIMNQIEQTRTNIVFQSKSGPLLVDRLEDRIRMKFPIRKGEIIQALPSLLNAFSFPPKAVLKSRDYMLVFDREEQIRTIKVDLDALKQIDALGFIITAKGDQEDFVLRFFAPSVGVNEDPVTGSAFCTATPYWSSVLQKTSFISKQLSKRTGIVYTSLENDAVWISGHAALYAEGTIFIE